MNIGQVAQSTGLSIKQIRDYEKAGLIAPPARAVSNYRCYDAQTVARLLFIARSRQVGFSLADIQKLLALQDDPHRKSCDVRALTCVHIDALTAKITQLQQIKALLQQWHDACGGDDNPNCAILDSLGNQTHHP